MCHRDVVTVKESPVGNTCNEYLADRLRSLNLRVGVCDRIEGVPGGDGVAEPACDEQRGYVPDRIAYGSRRHGEHQDSTYRDVTRMRA